MKRKILGVCMIVVLALAMNLTTFAESSVGTEKTVSLQTIDENGNVIDEKLISENELRAMKLSREGNYTQETYLSICKMNITIFYDLYYDHGVYYFSPSSFMIARDPAIGTTVSDLVKTPTRISGTGISRYGEQGFYFTPW